MVSIYTMFFSIFLPTNVLRSVCHTERWVFFSLWYTLYNMHSLCVFARTPHFNWMCERLFVCMQVSLYSILRLCYGLNLIKSVSTKLNEVATISNAKAERNLFQKQCKEYLKQNSTEKAKMKRGREKKNVQWRHVMHKIYI